jgi:uncharacterized protein HemY
VIHALDPAFIVSSVVLGRLLVVAGLVLVAVGILLSLAPSIPWLGRLPGDVRIERPGFRLYLPITTSLLLSALVSLVLYLLSKRGG